MSPPVQAARNYTHHRHLLLLLSPKADTHFTVPQKYSASKNGVTLKSEARVIQGR